MRQHILGKVRQLQMHLHLLLLLLYVLLQPLVFGR
jgi:hypothetical protein